MRRTGYYFTHHKEIVTKQYPESKKDMFVGERFRGEVIMIHNENNEHGCTGCSACEIACPNGSIRIISKFEIDPETNKKTKVIDQHIYHLGMCTFCNLCILSCPTDTIIMSNEFEHSTEDRKPLTKVLNKPGSKIMKGVEEKKK